MLYVRSDTFNNCNGFETAGLNPRTIIIGIEINSDILCPLATHSQACDLDLFL